jgi:hypothetical protein
MLVGEAGMAEDNHQSLYYRVDVWKGEDVLLRAINAFEGIFLLARLLKFNRR